MKSGANVRISKILIKRLPPGVVVHLKLLRHRLSQLRKAMSHIEDGLTNIKYMEWRTRRDAQVIEAELIFQYHKIEKGLCMPPPRRFFGMDPAKKTIELIYEWESIGGDRNSPAYLGAIEAMRSYAQSLYENAPPPEISAWMRPMLDKLLGDHPKHAQNYQTPIRATQAQSQSQDVFENLMLARRSVRHYESTPVPLTLIRKCISTAQLSPSACNRQPWHVHIYTNSDQIKSMLKLQNGNAGFGHQLTTLLVITSDRKSFFDASERNEPFIDGGLFSMSLILALQSHGVSSCCLNWCVDTEKDKQAHVVGQIPDSEAIIMYLAIGYADNAALVPRSARKTNQSTAIVH